ncbi:methyltransferase domain-containing protein [Modestobacter sp. I12A-02628]|uniref:Class I SAM-dependent methyltransferase n=1 Tax=Goekera deserti TaxID=2497753 RepID=A0A7K3WFD4_9ACTN|nr:cyclopropane-fatty-acyl-phospholipid synthase family protein [Goekera deserti]MPR00014.1 methyltransferase domain-containing protein [Goekera deserti]NDI49792.1 methyltransferase domain-containing protein [Goekera deserti]NEL55154.1 class I SAM-dependent methyltransferase [Goekera deserti]
MTTVEHKPTDADDARFPVPRPDECVWPGLAVPPHDAFRARIAEALFKKAVATLPVRVVYPDGTVLGSGDRSAPVMRMVRPATVYHRLGADAKIGFGEAYMTGDWTTGLDTDLADLLAPFAARMSHLVHPLLQRLRHVAERTQPIGEENTKENSRHNISRHYDLSNELFEAFLDETMTYSSGWFEPGDDLLAAQVRKIDGVLDMARVREGMHVLEIGSGWGALAIRAARDRGARVTTLTLSTEQQALARRRAEDAGVGHLVEVRLQDYRDARGQYDAVVSVEMIEAVGEKFWATYFTALDTLLKPGGRVGLQSITMPHDRMMASRRAYTWIHKYVFPGGIIPSIRSIEQNLDAHTRLSIVERRDLGPHYARTLQLWRERFGANWDSLDGSFDETFQRMWEFYLAYCEAGFRVGYLGVSQLGLARHPFPA